MGNTNIPSILKKIVDTKHQEIAKLEALRPLAIIQEQAQALYDSRKQPRRRFAAALTSRNRNNQLGIIAEIKKASPSKGVISANFNPSVIAQQYEQAGATCLSVLTDVDYFQGHNEYLIQAHQACALPILRKDFMIAPYQIYESYLLGADCILLIMACLDDDTVATLHAIACSLGMDVLIEIHTEEELQRALKLPNNQDSATNGSNMYGVNNRDLNTFKTDLNTTLTLVTQLRAAFNTQQAQVNDGNDNGDGYGDGYGNDNKDIDNLQPLFITESGIHNSDDIRLMLDNDISNFLIGEQFMKTDNPGHTLQSLIASVSSST